MQIVKTSLMLGWRNLWRNHRRTLVMLAAITTGVWAMIFMTALMRGMVHDMIRDGIDSLPGYVQVHDPAFRDDPSVANLISIPDSELMQRFNAARIERFSTRINVPAIVSSERDSRGVILYGIDPASERTVTSLAENLVEGRYLESDADKGIIIGRKLAEKLETGLGKRIVLMSQDQQNDIVDRGFRIVGIFKAKLEAREESGVYAAKKTVQDLLRIGDRVTEVAIAGDNYRNVNPLQTSVANLVGKELEVLPWQQLNTYLGSMLKVMDGFVLVWMVVIFLALSFGLVNTLAMAVFERVREIGLMMALGLRPAGILLQVVTESLMLLAIGLAAGSTLAWLTIQPLQSGIDISQVAQGMEMFGASSVLYPELTAADVLLANGVVL
ncbi:MAG: ABC transporter permease, partial [Woeseiaceae bacterium]|nr:ABC transporter permease [Woeseiaceae bacterium]